MMLLIYRDQGETRWCLYWRKQRAISAALWTGGTVYGWRGRVVDFA